MPRSLMVKVLASGVERHVHGEVALFALEVAALGQGLQLLRGIYSVRYHLTQENLMVRIEKLFDDGENVFSRNPDVTFFIS